MNKPMKIKSRFSIVAVLLMMVFATNVSCQEESITKQDTKKDVHENEKNKFSFDNEIKLTSDNYVTENRLHIVSLEQKLESIAEQKKLLLVAIQKGDKNAEIEFNNLAKEENEANTALDILLKNEYLYKVKPKPIPCPPVIHCGIVALEYVVISDIITSLNYTLTDSKGKVIYTNSEISPMSNYKGLGAMKISTNGYEGSGYLKIVQVENNMISSYTLKVKF